MLNFNQKQLETSYQPSITSFLKTCHATQPLDIIKPKLIVRRLMNNTSAMKRITKLWLALPSAVVCFV